MIVSLCLVIMAFLMFFSIITGGNYGTETIETIISDDQLVNGTTSTFSTAGSSSFYIDPVLGAIVIIIGLIVLASVFSIRILGSGLSGTMSRFLIVAIAYTGLWGMMSVLASPLINAIGIYGSMVYIALTFAFITGIIQKYTGGDNG